MVGMLSTNRYSTKPMHSTVFNSRSVIENIKTEPDPIMNITPILKDGLLTLILNGRFDTFGAGPVQQTLDAYFHEHPKAIIMDMTNVDFISSAGIRVLLITAKEVESRKGVVALVGLKPYCRELIQSIHIAGALPQFDTLDQAETFCREKTSPPA